MGGVELLRGEDPPQLVVERPQLARQHRDQLLEHRVVRPPPAADDLVDDVVPSVSVDDPGTGTGGIGGAREQEVGELQVVDADRDVERVDLAASWPRRLFARRSCRTTSRFEQPAPWRLAPVQAACRKVTDVRSSRSISAAAWAPNARLERWHSDVPTPSVNGPLPSPDAAESPSDRITKSWTTTVSVYSPPDCTGDVPDGTCCTRTA